VIYVKSVLAGLAAVLTVFAIVFLVTVVAPLFLMMSRAGSGGIGAVSTGFGISGLAVLIVVALASFAGGFYWEFRRASRRRS
jgi:hypothetical protein